MRKSSKEQLDLYIKQGKAYAQLLEKANPNNNSSKIKKITQKVERASKKMRQMA